MSSQVGKSVIIDLIADVCLKEMRVI